MGLNLLAPDQLSGMHVIGSGREANRALLTLAARLAIHEPVRVIDVGCGLDIHRIAREVRKQGPWVHQALENVLLSRAFGCWQAGEAIHALPHSCVPLLVFDLPTPFYDEAVPFAERMRLMKRCTSRLREHAAGSPVLISARPSINENDQAILTYLLEAADAVHLINEEDHRGGVQKSLL